MPPQDPNPSPLPPRNPLAPTPPSPPPSSPVPPSPQPPVAPTAPAPSSIDTSLYTDPTGVSMFSAPPKKSHKKLIIGIIVAIILLLGGSALAYSLYQAPDKVVSDAFSQAVNSKSVLMTGDLKVTSTQSSPLGQEFLAQFSLAAEGTKMSADANLTVDGVKYGGSVLTTGKQESYFRVKNVKDIVTKIFGEGISTQYKTFIDKVSNKWIKVSPETSDEMTKDIADQQVCAEKAFDTFSKDKTQRDEVVEVYKKNPLFKTKQTGEETIAGVDTLKLQLTPSNKFPQFVGGLKQTKIFKALDSCAKGDLTKSANEAIKDTTPDTSPAKLELWIAKWDHHLVQVKLSVKEDGVTTTITARPLFGKPVTIEAPSDFMTLKQLTDAFIAAFAGEPSGGLPGSNPQLN